MTVHDHQGFDSAAYLLGEGHGRRSIPFRTKRVLFTQGGAADSVFYLQSGRAELSVVSKGGKKATITLLTAGDFIGEECLAGVHEVRMASARAIVPCVALRIERLEMQRVLREEPAFSNFFLHFLLLRGMRSQSDMVDQLFNSSEKRLARMLILLAGSGKPGDPPTLLPKITQETLAEMIGSTRPSVSQWMNRFRKLGFIEYNGQIHIHKPLLDKVLDEV